MSSEEQSIWTGGPSQWVNFKFFLLCLLIVPIPYAVWKWLHVKCIKYELTNQRLKITHGVLTKHIDEIELYRVKDMTLVQPFILRLLSLGNVLLVTSDKSTPEFLVEAIPDAENFREQLRAQVETIRDKKRVREVDFE